MKKIMFNETYNLTQAVLAGEKTMTRRIVSPSVINSYDAWYEEFLYKRTGEEPYQTLEEYIINTSKYKVGEVVAIAQSYLDIGNPQFDKFGHDVAGNTNKMFVRADLMPHHIKITDVRVERLQDISDEDCLCEGIKFRYVNMNFGNSLTREDYYYEYLDRYGEKDYYGTDSPKRTFSILIDKICGYDTWESNPLVVVYSFKLSD